MTSGERADEAREDTRVDGGGGHGGRAHEHCVDQVHDAWAAASAQQTGYIDQAILRPRYRGRTVVLDLVSGSDCGGGGHVSRHTEHDLHT